MASDETAFPVSCRVVPFVRGRRPTDEAACPGLGSSDQVAMLLAADNELRAANRAYVLYNLPSALGSLSVDVTLALAGPDGADSPVRVAGWDERVVEPTVFELNQ